jgi:hypothetical protein
MARAYTHFTAPSEAIVLDSDLYQDFLSLPVRIISSFMSDTGNRGAVSGKSPDRESLSAGTTENRRCSSLEGLASVRE